MKRVEVDRNYYFSTRDIILMAIFGAIGGLFVITTHFFRLLLPIHFPGLYGILYGLAATAFTLIARGLVRKFGAATFTSTIGGLVAFVLPGGPGILVLPMNIIEGVVIDSFLLLTHREVDDSPLVAAIAGFSPMIFAALFMWWGFKVVFGEVMPLKIVILIFVGLRGFLAVMGGLIAYIVLVRVRGSIS